MLEQILYRQKNKQQNYTTGPRSHTNLYGISLQTLLFKLQNILSLLPINTELTLRLVVIIS